MNLAATLAEGEEFARELPIPAWAYGVIALGVFVALLFVVTRFDPDR